MDWRDEGILLTVRRHGESAAIITVLTPQHGRHAGVVRGGASRRMSPILQPGAQLQLEWRARLADHIGSFTVDPIRSRAAQLMSDRGALLGFGALSALVNYCLPEREPHPGIYRRTMALLDDLSNPDWLAAYAIWELRLLEELGFGPDLSSCAATGASDELVYVSPKSGRAVSREGAGEWADRLLRLPPFLMGGGQATHEEMIDALRLTGYFLQNWLGPALSDRPVPEARASLVRHAERMQRP